MEFTKRGELIYTVHAAKADQIMLLTYRVEGDEIVTDQASRPMEVRTRFEILADGKLCLYREGAESIYSRTEKALA